MEPKHPLTTVGRTLEIVETDTGVQWREGIRDRRARRRRKERGPQSYQHARQQGVSRQARRRDGELVNLLVEKGGEGIYLYQARDEDAVELYTYEGKRVRLHCTALGKTILGLRANSEVETFLDKQGMPAMTAHIITGREEVLAELEAVRDQGYAVDCKERLNGLRCIAAPITDDPDGGHRYQRLLSRRPCRRQPVLRRTQECRRR